MAKKPKMGRPKAAPGEKRDKPIKAMVTAGELAEVQAAAEADSRNVADWVRVVVLDAAKVKRAR